MDLVLQVLHQGRGRGMVLVVRTICEARRPRLGVTWAHRMIHTFVHLAKGIAMLRCDRRLPLHRNPVVDHRRALPMRIRYHIVPP